MIHSKNTNTPEKSYKENFFKIFPLQTEKDIHSMEQKLIDETYYEQTKYYACFQLDIK